MSEDYMVRHPDRGCDYAPRCLECELALCRFDLPGGLPEAIRLTNAIASEKKRRAKLADLTVAAAHVRERVALEHNITVRELVSTSRRADHVQARFQLYEELRGIGASLKLIGIMAHRDHSTVIYGLRRAKGQAPKPAKARR